MGIRDGRAFCLYKLMLDLVVLTRVYSTNTSKFIPMASLLSDIHCTIGTFIVVIRVSSSFFGGKAPYKVSTLEGSISIHHINWAEIGE